jgi:hypothetical protein
MPNDREWTRDWLHTVASIDTREKRWTSSSKDQKRDKRASLAIKNAPVYLDSALSFFHMRRI